MLILLESLGKVVFMQVLSGKSVADHLKSQILGRSRAFKAKSGRSPKLVVLIVGEDPASQVYVRNKKTAAESVEFLSEVLRFPDSVMEKDLVEKIKSLNSDPNVDGILVQLPLPKNLDEEKILNSIHPSKDVDCLGMGAMGAVWSGQSEVGPCTPKGVMHILKHYGIDPAGLNAVVVGRSLIVGKPMANLLLEANATVTICHSKTKNIREHLLRADLVVVAAGKSQFLGKEDFKKNAIVIDVGIHGSGMGGKITGDVRYSELEGWASAATPVPGGVGPMTIASLLENTLILAESRAK